MSKIMHVRLLLQNIWAKSDLYKSFKDLFTLPINYQSWRCLIYCTYCARHKRGCAVLRAVSWAIAVRCQWNRHHRLRKSEETYYPGLWVVLDRRFYDSIRFHENSVAGNTGTLPRQALPAPRTMKPLDLSAIFR